MPCIQPDALSNVVKDPGTESQSLRSSILANALFEMLVLCQMARSRIACVFTCENETAIHALLRRPCVLGKTLELPPPSSHARVEVGLVLV